MTAPAALLHLFAYGEHLDGPQQRSLGFRLLAPVEPAPWGAEVEALARGLQGAPYPDQWPPVDLFCSVLLADGQRLIAVARYGLADHTPSRRRSGLELVGVVGPGSLNVSSALAIYDWLKHRRNQCEDLRSLGGTQALEEVLAQVPAPKPANEPLPVLPIRMWQDGALLFAATAPSDPDRRLALLEPGIANHWQWLPLVGADFPLAGYVQRGPLVAWTPHLAGVALKLDRQTPEPRAEPARRSLFAAVLGILVLLLLGANLWATLALPHRLPSSNVVETKTSPTPRTTPATESADRERFIQAVYQLLQRRGVLSPKDQSRLIGQYEGLLAEDEALRVNSPEGKAAVGALDVLARRGPGQVEALVREALTGKGYDAELINRACALVREKMNEGKSPR